MARSNVLNTNTINYLDLIGNGKRYRVPPYQRDYSWSEEQWEDGQQRLATLSVLALAVIARLRAMADEGIETDANRERARELRNRFIGEKDPASLTESSRLYLNETDPATIEHILPENPADDWEETFDSARWDTSVYRLGNLTLLESAANRRIGNAAYLDKVSAYSESTYAISQDIPRMAPEEWTPELLEARQSRLAARAVHLWRADFA